MKKFLRFAFFMTISLTGLVASAQTAKQTATTTLNVNLADAYNITVGNSAVNIDMSTVADFQNGKASTPQLLTVNATQGYEVRVKTSTNNLTFGKETIPVNTINVTPSLFGTGTAPVDAPTLQQNTALSSTETMIIKKGLGETQRQYNVVYAISAANTSAYLNKPAGTYATTVTYSLYAK